MRSARDQRTSERLQEHGGIPKRTAGFAVFLHVARSGLVISIAMLAVALLLRSASFLIVGLAAISYTLVLCGMVTAQYEHVAVTPSLRHSVATVRQPNMITWTALTYAIKSPVLLTIEPLLPPYVIQRHRRVGDGSVTVFFDATRKGIYPVGGARVILQDPLRVFRIQYVVAPGLSLTVVPRPVSLTSMHIALTSPIDGQRVRYAPNVDTSQLTGTHPYDGEPMNRIHWKMTAHTGQVVVKDFTPSASQTAIVVVNYSVNGETSFALETLDDTLSTAATSILHYVHDRKLPFAVAALGSHPAWTGPGHDSTHLLECLAALASAQVVRSDNRSAVQDWLDRNMRTIPARSQLIILAHEMSEAEVVHLLRQREHFVRIMIILFPEGTFRLPSEHRAPYYLRDTDRLLRLRSLQHVLQQNGIELTIVGLNDALSALATA